MTNSTLPLDTFSNNNWCIPWTKLVYLYGHLIPAIALFIFGLTFNPIALYYFATSRNFRRSAYSYYFSAIAVFDLLRLIIWCLFLLLDYKIFKLHFHSFECSIQVFSESVASTISAWLTVSLTVERCLVIYKPLQTLTGTRDKRALIVILCVILASCAVNSLFLQPGFYKRREYDEAMRTIICFYEDVPTGNLTETTNNSIPDLKRTYTLFIVILRVIIPFMLLLTANVILFISLRKIEKQSSNPSRILLVRHGHHRKITPMIFFSSCILLLTVSPRYLLQFSRNFLQESLDSLDCSLTHFGPHLLKAVELFNYSFNVFISIVSGKHGRHELFDMLLCRSNNINSKINSSLGPQPLISVKLRHLQRFDKHIGDQINSTHKPFLPNNNNYH